MSPERPRREVMQELLRRPFPPKLIGKLPRTAKRPALDYVGHAAVTDRLQAADPDWTWKPERMFDFPHPEGNCWIEGWMEVGGVRRYEYGHGPNPMEAASHFIRRAAMRFGVALDLWSKEELIEASAPSSLPVQGGRDGGGGDVGEGDGTLARGEGAAASDPSPAQPETPSGQPEGHHDHHWKPSPTMNGWEYCDVKGCGKARRRPR